VSFIHLGDAVKPPTINAKLTVGASFILHYLFFFWPCFFLLLATSWFLFDPAFLAGGDMELWSHGILGWEQGRHPIMNLICGRLWVAAKGMIKNHGGGDGRKADRGTVWNIVGGTRLGYGRL
jgi:hypothetical protein